MAKQCILWIGVIRIVPKFRDVRVLKPPQQASLEKDGVDREPEWFERGVKEA
jgi:hypothetical protein